MTNQELSEIQRVLGSLIEKEEFIESLQNAENMNQVRNLLLENGIELTAEEVVGFEAMGQEYFRKMNSEELDEEMLDSVAGGRFRPLKLLAGVGYTTMGVGLMVASGIVCAVPGGQAAGAFGMCVGGAGFIAGLDTIQGSF